MMAMMAMLPVIPSLAPMSEPIDLLQINDGIATEKVYNLLDIKVAHISDECSKCCALLLNSKKLSLILYNTCTPEKSVTSQVSQH